jgi:low temperature requirement protein LtrA
VDTLRSPALTPAQADDRIPMVGVLRALLLGEAVLGLAAAVFLSVLAVALRDFIGGDAGRSTEVNVRFAAGGAILFAIAAALASRGARRRRPWAWTLSVLLQLALAVGTGLAIIIATWHPVYLIGFALAAIVMLVLSTSGVRSALGQE